MRITNAMMINNTLSNINLNKLNVDKFNTQQSTEKKIQRPSDDPIIAVRALRFRSQLAELNQYLEKNIPDAESWLELSENALSGVSDTLKSMQQYINQGANDPLVLTDRKAVIDTLKQYRAQIYQDANFDYGGRRIFTGYKTDVDMTFAVTDKTVKYKITEEFDYTDFDVISKVYNKVDISGTPAEIAPADMPNDKTDIHRIRLAYDKLMVGDTTVIPATDVPTLSTVDAAGNQTAVNVTVVATASDGKYYPNGDNTQAPIDDPYRPGDNEVYFLADTGEIIMGGTAYESLKDQKLSLTYSKTGFEKGDLRPEHYFNCTRYEDDGTTEDVVFESYQQDINYTVNFNQKLKVNSEGRNLFGHDVIRDLDEIVNAVDEMNLIEEKMKEIKKMQEDPIYASEANQKALASMYEAAQKEYDLQEDILQKRFEKSLTLYANHQATIDAEIADIGSRYNRLSLNKTRLTTQQTTLEELKSSNEDTDLPETIIKLSAASMVYEASLSAASKVVTKSLLDYL